MARLIALACCLCLLCACTIEKRGNVTYVDFVKKKKVGTATQNNPYVKGQQTTTMKAQSVRPQVTAPTPPATMVSEIRGEYLYFTPSAKDWESLIYRYDKTGQKPRFFVSPLLPGQTVEEARGNGGHPTNKAQVGFARSVIQMKARPERLSQCQVAFTETGLPILLRPNETGIHQYAFFNYLESIRQGKVAVTMEMNSLKDQVSKQQKEIHDHTNKIGTYQQILAENRAYQGNQCVRVQQDPIPPKPKRIDPKIVDNQATGHCMTVVGGRTDDVDVLKVLQAKGQTAKLAQFQKYMAHDRRLACTQGITASGIDSTVCRGAGAIFRTLTRDAYYHCISTLLDTCISDVKQACNGDYYGWQSRVDSIKREPELLRQSCEKSRAGLSHLLIQQQNGFVEQRQAKIASMQQRIDRLEVENQQIMNPDSTLSLQDERTYCAL